jgi:NAD(P)-dependent dehydrogenase (short-subunit alcohol dehydrogenase family)
MTSYSFESLKNKVCVFTGGTGVLGASMVECLARVGVKVAIISRKLDAAEALADRLSKLTGSQLIGVQADVQDKDSLIAAKKVINSVLGPIEILINGAGGNSPLATTQVEQMDKTNLNELEKTFYGLEMEGFQKVFDLNFKGTLLPTMVFTIDMLEAGKGTILNISSMNSFRPLTKIPAYSAAKSSINNFTQWLAVHLAKTGIRVNCIAPGFFLTNQNRFLMIDEKTGAPTPRGNKVIAGTPMGKYGQPEDLNGAMLYLISDISNFVTGVIIPIDGGFSAFSGV